MLTWDEWNTCPPIYFRYRSIGRNEIEKRTYRTQWESSRLIAFHAIAPHLKASSRDKGIQKWLPFPWEKVEHVKEISVEEMLQENKEFFDKLTPVEKGKELPMDKGINVLKKVATNKS